MFFRLHSYHALNRNISDCNWQCSHKKIMFLACASCDTVQVGKFLFFRRDVLQRAIKLHCTENKRERESET